MSGERTETATPRRLLKLRGEGQVSRSQDLVAAAGLLATLVILQSTAGEAVLRLQSLLTGMFLNVGTVPTHPSDGTTEATWAQQAMATGAQTWILCLLPLFATIPLLGIGLNLCQGAVFAPKVLWSGWKRLNPLQGAQRLVSQQALVSLVRSLGKVLVVGAMAYRSLQADVAGYQSISASNDAAEIGLFLGQAAVGIATSGAIALFALALLDFIYQRWSFSRSSRMSKQEVKEENKQSQGDPLLRSRMRQRQRALAAGHRQLQDVPDATVVVTNPTHFAVALKYEKTMRSPIVVAKGADAVAAQIRAIAREAGVPMVENRPLARSLYDSAEVGDEIPMELYRAVAEVLAYIFSLRRRRAR